MTTRLSDLAAAEERRQSVRDASANFLRREWSLTRLRQTFEQECLVDAPCLWREMQALGWDRIEPTGEDIGASELCVLAEETGFAMAPTPLIPCAVGRSLLRGSALAASAALPMLAHTGPERATDPLGTTTVARVSGAGYRLEGEKRFIAYGAQADVLLVSANLEGGDLGLFTVPATAANLVREPLAMLDKSACAALRFQGVEVPAAARIACGLIARRQLYDACALETVARCAELVGVANRALDLAVDYAKVREAFGRPIGSFQAIQHKLVNLRCAVELARALYQGAAAQLASGSGGSGPAVAMAAFAALDDLRKVPEGALQVFGGIGTTWEHDIHLLLRRAATLSALLGERARYGREVAQHLAGEASGVASPP